MSRHRLLAASVLALFALIPVGCMGGDDESAPSSSSGPSSSSTTGNGATASPLAPSVVANVAGREISMGAYQAFLQQTKARYASEGRDLPKPGSAADATLKTGVVKFLVERAQLEQKAQELGIEVTDDEVAARLDLITQAQFGGSDAKLRAELAKTHVTMASFENDVRMQLVRERLYEKVTRDVRVTDEEARAYYDAHEDDYRTKVGLTEFPAVRQQIRQQLLELEKNEKMGLWWDAVRRKLSHQTTYQRGYTPPGELGKAPTTTTTTP